MKVPHFFKAKSRIGLANRPNRQKEFNIGVEDGAEAVIASDFLNLFPESSVTEFSFPNPETVRPEVFDEVLLRHFKAHKKQINETLEHGESQVVIGGDNSVSFSSVLAFLDRIEDPADLAYVQFDSHGDLHQKSTSPSNNFHGMYVRPLVDVFDHPGIDALVPRKIPVENVWYFGNLDLEPEEAHFFHKNKIKHKSVEKVQNKKSEVLKEFEQFISSKKHLHVNFDIDCLDKTIAPATGIPAEVGFLFEDIVEMLALIATHPSFSFDLSEVNPHKVGAAQTVEIARKILHIVLGKEKVSRGMERKQIAHVH